MKRESSFTLIEIAMVSVIVIMIGLIIIPRMAGLLKVHDLKTEARKLKAKIREVQQLAITMQKDYRIQFDLTNENYTINYDPYDSGTAETESLEKNIGIDSTAFTSNTVTFDIFGAPSGTSTWPGNIVLSDTSSNTSTISIAQATGRVTIQ